MGLKAFVDFDGTITLHDVGNVLFRRFGGPRCDELVREYREGRISAVECFRLEAESMGAVQRDALLAFVDGQQIDPDFPEFVHFCRERGITLTVVSDGLDLYIRRILAAHGLEDLPVAANHALLEDRKEGGVRLSLDFPRTNADCPRCACCKRNVMLTASGEDDLIVYVGDGYSDMCPARYADVIFAKGELQTFCQQENISYYLYRSFQDVTTRLEMLTARRRLHKRTSAEHLRRQAFTSE